MDELIARFRRLAEEKDWTALKRELHSMEAVPTSELLAAVPDPDKIFLFRLLPRPLATEVFSLLSSDEREDIVRSMAENRKELAALLNDLPPDDRTAFFEELPGEAAHRLVRLLSRKEREIAVRLLGYPEDSIGRLMTPEYVAVNPKNTAAQALEHIRKYGRDSETLDIIYVVDDEGKLLDDLPIREIILAAPERPVAELIGRRFAALNALDDQEIAVQALKLHNLAALPVTDRDGVLLGIVTFDDVMDVAEEEHTEDFQKFGGVDGLDLSYTQTPLPGLLKKRAGWLVALFLGEMFTATAMGYFDDEISRAVVLTLFIPLIISSGGNSGSQAASLIIRSLALDEIRFANWFYVLRKELVCGLLLGVVLGSIGFVRIFVWQKAGLYDYGEYWSSVALSVSAALVLTVMWGTLSGSMIPLALKRAGMDPAAASAPLVATLVDVTGLIIYFSVALLLLSGKLL